MLLCRTVPTGFGIDFLKLLDHTPSPVFEQWRTLYELEPWGEERSDEAIGTLIAHLAAVHGVNPQSPRQYMRLLRSEPEPQDQNEMKDTFESMCNAVAGMELPQEE